MTTNNSFSAGGGARASHRIAGALVALALLAVQTVMSGSSAAALTSLTTSQLQRDLTAMTYYAGEVDGVRDAELAAAVRAFQADTCLPVDGAATPLTQSSVLAKVKGIQSVVGVTRSGVYDSKTTSAVTKWEKTHGLPADGLADSATMAALGVPRVLRCSEGMSVVGGTITRAEVLERSSRWVELGVPYSQARYYPDQEGRLYRTDCSGFVSMAWHLGSSLVTDTIPNVTMPISKDDLRPGDALNAPGKHVVLFVGWADAERTTYVGREETSVMGRAVERVIPYPYWSGGYTPQRYVNVVD
jgi:cell wall-associated NlpC family hydrolase